MKRTLLLASFILGAHLTVNAQSTISFEESEGYTLGTLSGQNGWIVTDTGNEDGSGVMNIIVSDELENHDTNTLKFASTTSESLAEIDAIKNITPGTNTFSITQKIYAVGRDVDFGSDIILAATDVEGDSGLYTAAVTFTYEGNVQVLQGRTAGANGYYYFDETITTTYEPETWYEVKMTFNLSAGTVNYYLDNVLIAEKPLNTGVEVDAVSYNFDALTTSYFVDDITITAETAGIDKATAATFSVYPNPAITTINISNTDNALINSITVTDLNGRVVKTNEFTGVTNIQVNVSDLAAGVYMLNIASDKGVTNKKIVKN